MLEHGPYKLNIGGCLSEGWEGFKKHPWLLIGSFLFMYLVIIVIVLFAAFKILMIPTVQTNGLLLTLMFNLITALITAPLFIGIHRLWINTARETGPSFGDIFSGFQRFFKSMGTYLTLLVVYVVLMIPTWLYATLYIPNWPTPVAYGQEMSPVLPAVFGTYLLVLTLNSLVVCALLVRFVFVFFVIMDDADIGIIDAFRRSAAISRGNIWRLIGLFVVSGLIFTGLAFLLLIPAITIGQFIFVGFARAYLNLKAAHNGPVVAPEAVTPPAPLT